MHRPYKNGIVSELRGRDDVIRYRSNLSTDGLAGLMQTVPI